MGVQDAAKPFQNPACFELVKQRAFVIDFGWILGPIWEGFGGQRLRHEPSLLYRFWEPTGLILALLGGLRLRYEQEFIVKKTLAGRFHISEQTNFVLGTFQEKR